MRPSKPRRETNDERPIGSRETREDLTDLLTRMQAAATEIPQRPKVDWGHAEQMHDALQYADYAAFAMGVVSEDESRDLGFPC